MQSTDTADLRKRKRMKYKEIDAMLHNFGHSFVSLMNYVDDVHIADVLQEYVWKAESHEIRIDFHDGCITPNLDFPQAFERSIALWKAWLPKHMRNHRIDEQSLAPVVLRFRLTNQGPEVIVETKDDRGKAHKVFVRT
ncbi:MAG: hypothetical protein RIS44_2588 [Pseudomonadota bacterium]|jgi:hypothetical protein